MHAYDWGKEAKDVFLGPFPLRQFSTWSWDLWRSSFTARNCTPSSPKIWVSWRQQAAAAEIPWTSVAPEVKLHINCTEVSHLLQISFNGVMFHQCQYKFKSQYGDNMWWPSQGIAWLKHMTAAFFAVKIQLTTPAPRRESGTPWVFAKHFC